MIGKLLQDDTEGGSKSRRAVKLSGSPSGAFNILRVTSEFFFMDVGVIGFCGELVATTTFLGEVDEITIAVELTMAEGLVNNPISSYVFFFMEVRRWVLYKKEIPFNLHPSILCNPHIINTHTLKTGWKREKKIITGQKQV